MQGAKLLRSWLDEYGLRAQGNHGFIPPSWPLTTANLDTFKKHLEIANILGMAHMGTGGDPTGSAYRADWDVAADKWNALGEIARREGLKLYTHNHDAAYGFLLDGGPLDAQGNPTRSSGIRKLEYFLKITDPKVVWLEMDIFWAHVAQYKFHTYTAHDKLHPGEGVRSRRAQSATTSVTRFSTPRTASSTRRTAWATTWCPSAPASSTTPRSSRASVTGTTTTRWSSRTTPRAPRIPAVARARRSATTTSRPSASGVTSFAAVHRAALPTTRHVGRAADAGLGAPCR